MNNPIIRREFIGLLRMRRAFALQVAVALLLALLVVIRWPTGAKVDLSGAPARQVFSAFGYGLLAAVILLVPVFPATTIVREKNQGTLALLLNSPMSSWSIYFGKLTGVLGFALLLLIVSAPAAMACHAMGGVSLTEDIMVLYALLALAAIQYVTLGLLVSSCANSTDAALRITYGLVLMLAVVTLGPHFFLQGQPGVLAELAARVRCVSPIPAVMEVLGHSGIGGQGLLPHSNAAVRFAAMTSAGAVAMVACAISRLNYAALDRSRSQGVITDDRTLVQRVLRRLMFVVDPQRRKRGIGALANPVMIKEFRSRRFGRSHWMLRLAAGCAILSLALTYATATGSIAWGVDAVGGIMVMLQMALIVLLTPSLAAGLISSERESGGWELLMMTPLSAGAILRGKITSVVWTLTLIMFATLPGYVFMVYVRPALWPQVSRVLICLGLAAVFAVLLSAAAGSFFRRMAQATTVAYALLAAYCGGTMLVWLGRDAPFGRDAVETVLKSNPLAAGLSVIEMPGFAQYDLVPANWRIMIAVSACLAVLLAVQTWRLSRPR